MKTEELKAGRLKKRDLVFGGLKGLWVIFVIVMFFNVADHYGWYW